MMARTSVAGGLLALGVLSLAEPGFAKSEPAPDVLRGERVFRRLCADCHGRYGRGEGPAAEFLAVRPPDFTDSRILAGRSDADVLAALTVGARDPDTAHTPMTLGATLKGGVLDDAISYIRTLSQPGKRVSVLAGRDIYNGSCWVCHGVQGDGRGPAAGNLVGVKPRDFTSKDFSIEGREEEVYRTISVGAARAFHGSAYMPAWGTALSRQQILDVMEYLKIFAAGADARDAE